MSKCSTTSEPGTPDFDFQFDRNTGTCVDNSGDPPFLPSCKDPSGDSDPCADQALDFVGYIGHSSDTLNSDITLPCQEWYYCYQQKIHEQGECPCGQEFDSETNPCKTATAGEWCGESCE